MLVKSGPFLNDRVDIGNRNKDLCGRIGHGFGDGKLIKIARIIVVDGAPGKVSEITRRWIGLRRRPVDCIKLGERLGREIGKKPSFDHRPTCDSLQEGAVLSVI
jgi:hypothetical protein